jgi:hypothetical protein
MFSSIHKIYGYFVAVEPYVVHGNGQTVRLYSSDGPRPRWSAGVAYTVYD